MPANALPNASQPATGKPCQAQTKRGKPCPWSALDGSSFCLLHDPTKGVERRAALQAKGRNGKRKQVSRRVQASKDVSLATTAKIREILEDATSLVMASSEGACAKANTLARICSVAHDTIKTTEMQKEIEELRALVAQLKS